MVPYPQDSGIPQNTDNARIHLPIEGQTAWPQLLRLIGVGSLMTVLMLSFILMQLASPDELKIDPDLLVIGLVCLVVFEIVLFRRLVIPMNGDYGRYRIARDRVDFYPLSALGMRVLTRPDSVPVSDFTGIAIHEARIKGSAPSYTVVLMHPQRCNIIRVRAFPARADADVYARALADALSLDIL